MKIFKIALYISLFLFPQWSYSSMDRPQTDQDFALLPPYCKARKLTGESRIVDPALIDLWRKRFGNNFQHIHHYCYGLFDRQNANKLLDKSKRNGLLSTAIKEMQYVLQHATPDFAMLPRISYDIGRIREELGDPAGAMQAYYQSIKLNPKLPIPYAALSDLFKKQNDTKNALAILEQGLKYKNNSKTLLKRKALLSKDKPN